jgi:hypothetical protein
MTTLFAAGFPTSPFVAELPTQRWAGATMKAPPTWCGVRRYLVQKTASSGPCLRFQSARYRQASL